uniref:Uncharacterized protein n=1 Tax=Myotis myotis TaxID=51298 RepID=A0A7J8AN19_MYOMY|nr:hypothetical protein mMyoMyo1_008213 [Myotis myotis]
MEREPARCTGTHTTFCCVLMFVFVFVLRHSSPHHSMELGNGVLCKWFKNAPWHPAGSDTKPPTPRGSRPIVAFPPGLRSASQWCQQQKAVWGARSMIYVLPCDLPFCHYFSCPSSQPLPIARCLAPTSGMKPSGLCFRRAVMKVYNLPYVFGNLEFLSFVSKDQGGW